MIDMVDRKYLDWLPITVFLGLCIAVFSYLWLTGQGMPAPGENVNAFYVNTILIAIIAFYALVVVLQFRATYKKILKQRRDVEA